MKDFNHKFPKKGKSSGRMKANPTPAFNPPGAGKSSASSGGKSNTPRNFPKKGKSGSGK